MAKLKEITFGTEMKTADDVESELDNNVLRADKTQSFNSTKLNKLWSNLGIDNFTNEAF